MKVYIVTPANIVTGGCELCHQLCSAINELTNTEAYICYDDITDKTSNCLGKDVEAPAEYLCYGTRHISSAEEMDKPENIVIVGEGGTIVLPFIKNAKKVLWWMSVDNYIYASGEEDMEYIKNNVLLHLFQSYYSKWYVNLKIPSAEGLFLSDYINKEFISGVFYEGIRNNVALYNPLKGADKLKALMNKSTWLKWIPLTGFTRHEMAQLMFISKIYVDFGNHPGKDRIPREAAVCGCCVITNREGSAYYYQDVPIPEKYKFETPEDQLDEIDDLMRKICDNFELYSSEFDEYRRIIRGEERTFNEGVKELVKRLETL